MWSTMQIVDMCSRGHSSQHKFLPGKKYVVLCIYFYWVVYIQTVWGECIYDIVLCSFLDCK